MIATAFFLHTALFLVLAVYLIRGRRFLSPLAIYLLFHFIAFVLRPFTVFFLGFGKFDYIGVVPSDEELLGALFLTDIFLIAFALPLLKEPEFHLRRQNRPCFRSEKFEFSLFLFTAALFLPFIITSVMMQLTSVVLRTDNGMFVHGISSGYIWDGKNALYGLMVLTAAVFRSRYPTYFVFVLLVGVNLFIGNGRWQVVIALLFIIFYRHWFIGLRVRFLRLALVSVVALIFFNFSTHNRDFLKTSVGASSSELGYSFSLQNFDTLDFSNFDTLVFIKSAIPEKTNDYRYGSQYLGLFTDWIPRSLWADKPIGSPVVFYDLNEHGNFRSLTYSLVGDGWSNGGYIGLIATAWIFSTFLRMWYSRGAFHNDRIIRLSYMGILPLLIFLYRDGGVAVFRLGLISFAPVVIWMGLRKVLRYARVR